MQGFALRQRQDVRLRERPLKTGPRGVSVSGDPSSNNTNALSSLD